MDVCVKRFLNNIYQPKLITLTVPKESCLSLFLDPHSPCNLGLVCHVFFMKICLIVMYVLCLSLRRDFTTVFSSQRPNI